jgi:hypothetical protein
VYTLNCPPWVGASTIAAENMVKASLIPFALATFQDITITLFLATLFTITPSSSLQTHVVDKLG